MISDIKTVAQGTFDRYFRMKELYVIIALCIVLVLIFGRYDELTLNMGREFMIDGALAILGVVGLITAMAVIFEKSREMREKTAHFIITKPHGRCSYIWGKFLGVSALSLFNIGLITIGSLIMFKVSSLGIDVNAISTNFIYAAILIAVESFALVALGLFLSLFLSDTIATIALFLAFVLGHSLYMVPRLKDMENLAWACNVFPNFFCLDLKSEVTADIAIAPEYLWLGILYGVLYAAAFVCLSVVVFSRKDIA